MDANQKCETPGCGRDAACFGAYEGVTEKTYACDGCCGHGNEDGRCEPVDAIRERETQAEIVSLREQVRMLTAERDEWKAKHASQVEWAQACENERVDAQAEAEALRARVAELEEEAKRHKEAAARYYGERHDADMARVAAEAEREAAQQRAKALTQALREAGHALTLGTPDLVQASIQKIWALVGTEAP